MDLAANSSFRELRPYFAIGAVMNQLVGPGPSSGSERLYVSYSYHTNATDIVAIDPDTGLYDTYNVPLSSTVRAMAVGPDGKVYLGTYPSGGGAKFYRIDPSLKTLTDLGSPSLTEQVIWNLAVGTDGKVYGGTYPGARLVCCDPATGAVADLGRLDETEKYARYVAADSSGFLYAAIGTVQCRLIAHEISSLIRRNILPAEYNPLDWSISFLGRRGPAGEVYALVASKTDPARQQWLLLGNGTAVEVAATTVPAVVPSGLLRDGRQVVSHSGGLLKVRTQGQIVERPYLYQGKAMGLFRLGLGPDGKVYGSTALPAHLVRVDGDATVRLDTAAEPLGSGQVYSFLPCGGALWMATYAAQSALLVYDPARPYQPGTSQDANPYRVPPLPEIEGSWRPVAMIEHSDAIYVGSVPGYGKLGGYLTVVDPVERRMVSAHQVVADQSVCSLAAWKCLVIGATSVEGGGGVVPTAADARLFVWNPVTSRKLLEVTPVPGAISINRLVTTPAGKVLGIARKPGATADVLFVFDPVTGSVVHTAPMPDGIFSYFGGAVGPDGLIYGLYRNGIYAIDPATYAVAVVARYPGITGGFAMTADSVFFFAGLKIVQWTFA